MNVSMLKTQDQIFKKTYPIQLKRLPRKKGIVRPGRKTNMNTVNTRNTQKAYSFSSRNLIIFNEIAIEPAISESLNNIQVTIALFAKPSFVTNRPIFEIYPRNHSYIDLRFL